MRNRLSTPMRVAALAMAMALSAAGASAQGQAKPSDAGALARAAYTACMRIERLGDGSPFDCEWTLRAPAKAKAAVAKAAPVRRDPAVASNAPLAPSATLAPMRWTPSASDKAAYQTCLKLERQGEELYIDCSNLLRRLAPAPTSPKTTKAQVKAASLALATPKKWTPSRGALAARAKCLAMRTEANGEEAYFDCDNIARRAPETGEPSLKLASAKRARPEPNYWGEGCESGCLVSQP